MARERQLELRLGEERQEPTLTEQAREDCVALLAALLATVVMQEREKEAGDD